MFIKKYTVEFLVLTIILSLLLVNVIWLRLDTRPPHWDFAINIISSISHLENLKNYDISSLIFSYSYWPPLSYYITSITFLFFGINEDIAALSLSPYLIILIFFTYKLGELLQSKKFGLLSSIVLIGMPFLMSQTREYQLDFPLTSMVVMNAYLFFKSNFFRNNKYSILFGIGSGFGLLTKWTYIVFLFSVLILSVIKFLKLKQKVILINLFLAFTILCFIAGPWYLSNISNLKDSYIKNIQNPLYITHYKLSYLESLLFYFKALYLDHLHLPYLILLLWGVAYILVVLRKNKNVFLILMFSVFYILIMPLYSIKEPRYIEPITPFLAIIAVFWTQKIKHNYVRILLTAIILTISVFNYITFTFGIKSLPERLEYRVLNIPLLLYKQGGYQIGLPQKEDWFVEKIVKAIAKSWNETKKKEAFTNITLIQENDKMFFNSWTLRYYQILHLPNNIFVNSFFLKDKKCENIVMMQSQYLIINIDSVPLLQNCLRLANKYKKMKESILPDRSSAFLLRNSL